MKFEMMKPQKDHHQDAWHVVVVEPEDPKDALSPPIMEVYHPETCRIQITDPPDPMWFAREYMCMTSREIGNVGYDTIFPDGLKEGVYQIRPWLRYHPSTPSHGGEWEGGVEVINLEDR